MSSGGERSTLPKPPWSTAREKRARAPLTRELLTDVALRIVDAEGLDALSMRRLADEVKAVPSALYAHLSSKEELIQLMVDQVSGEIAVPLPDPRRWAEQLKELARGIHQAMGRHRDLARAFLGSVPTGHATLKVLDGMLALMVAGRLPRQVAAYGADLLPMYIYASAYEGSLFVQRMQDEPDYFEKLGRYMRSLPPERYPTATGMVEELLAHDDETDRRFEFGLDVIVRGLAAMASRR